MEDYECVEMEVPDIDLTKVSEAVKEMFEKFNEKSRKMRPIKFRAKTTANGHWVYGSLVVHSGKYYSIQNKKSNPWIYPETVGQFTGLKDKNGKEIYEGDIVRYYDDIEDELLCAEVYYSSVFCSFDVVSKKRGACGLSAFREYEVIGNIYDNPELIRE